jgi:hypothetical protein
LIAINHKLIPPLVKSKKKNLSIRAVRPYLVGVDEGTLRPTVADCNGVNAASIGTSLMAGQGARGLHADLHFFVPSIRTLENAVTKEIQQQERAIRTGEPRGIEIPDNDSDRSGRDVETGTSNGRKGGIQIKKCQILSGHIEKRPRYRSICRLNIDVQLGQAVSIPVKTMRVRVGGHGGRFRKKDFMNDRITRGVVGNYSGLWRPLRQCSSRVWNEDRWLGRLDYIGETRSNNRSDPTGRITEVGHYQWFFGEKTTVVMIAEEATEFPVSKNSLANGRRNSIVLENSSTIIIMHKKINQSINQSIIYTQNQSINQSIINTRNQSINQ